MHLTASGPNSWHKLAVPACSCFSMSGQYARSHLTASGAGFLRPAEQQAALPQGHARCLAWLPG